MRDWYGLVFFPAFPKLRANQTFCSLERRFVVLQQCDYVVLDEADRMIDMGFEDVSRPAFVSCFVFFFVGVCFVFCCFLLDSVFMFCSIPFCVLFRLCFVGCRCVFFVCFCAVLRLRCCESLCMSGSGL